MAKILNESHFNCDIRNQENHLKARIQSKYFFQKKAK